MKFDTAEFRNRYHMWKQGMKVYDEGKPVMLTSPQTMTAGGPETDEPAVPMWMQEVRQRAYDNIKPFGYSNAVGRINDAIINNRPEQYNPMVGMPETTADVLDLLWGEYLSIPQSKRHDIDPANRITETQGYTDGRFFSLPRHSHAAQRAYDRAFGQTVIDDTDMSWYDDPALRPGETTQLHNDQTLGSYTVGRGIDPNRGDFAWYTDTWDINPYASYTKGQYKVDKNESDIPMWLYDAIKQNGDLGGPILSRPVNIYGKVYADEQLGLPKGSLAPSDQYPISHVLPEVTKISFRPRKFKRTLKKRK